MEHGAWSKEQGLCNCRICSSCARNASPKRFGNIVTRSFAPLPSRRQSSGLLTPIPGLLSTWV